MAAMLVFGPELPGVGSWEWVGRDVAEELGRYYRVGLFQAWELPEAEVVVVVKQAPPQQWAEGVSRRARVVYCPVDYYGSAAEIDADGPMIRRCSRVIVHCQGLRRYFAPYARVAYMDHHVKFAVPPNQRRLPGDLLLWVGVHTNLPALVEWVNDHPLPGPLRVLTNLEVPGQVPTAAAVGFRPGRAVVIEEWTPGRQAAWMAEARAALDVKDGAFRSRHKPPAKAIDFLASGVPLALAPGHSAAEHLAGMGFEAPSPLDEGRWLSAGYREETRRFGAALGELLSRERVGRRWRYLLDEVLHEPVPGLGAGDTPVCRTLQAAGNRGREPAGAHKR
jgi:hypothetical protein